MATIQFYPEELDYVNAKLLCRMQRLEPICGSFLEAFCRACLAADGENYELLRPVLHSLIDKYPARPERLAMERRDRGVE